MTEEMFEVVRYAYLKANKDYLEKQLEIASEHLTEEQKKRAVAEGYIY